MLHTQTVSQDLLVLTKRLMQDDKLQDFRIVGGTALALQMGHRTSIDLDLFKNQSFDARSLQDHLILQYHPNESGYIQNNVSCYINNIKVDLASHQYPWLDPPIIHDGIRMATIRDISAMKLNAIHGTGDRQKDFVDVFFLLEKLSLNKIVNAFNKKYPESFSNIARNSIRIFDRLEPQEKIKLLDNTLDWNKIKGRLEDAVKNPNKIYRENLQCLLPKKTQSDGHQHKPKL